MLASLSDNRIIEYEDTGCGAPLVLLHAFPLTNRMWRPQIDAFGRDFRVLAPNLRGFGRSSTHQSTLTLKDAAMDVADWLDYLPIDEPIILGGLSMGGYLSFEFARRFPSKLRALILADTKAEADSDEAKTKRSETIAFARHHSAGEVFDRMQFNLFGPTTRGSHPELIESARQIAVALEVSAIIAALEALRDRGDSRDLLPQIAAPTLVVCGEEDAITPPDIARQMASQIPGAHLEIIAQAGHLSNLEQPHAFNRVVREWLQRLPSPVGPKSQ